MSLDRKSYERARDLGKQALRAGRKEDACPYRRGTNDLLRSAWLRGYEEERADRRRR